MPPVNDISTIVSLLPIKVDENKPGLIPSQFIIPPVKDPQHDFNIFHVVRAKFPVYLDEDRPALIVPAPSDQVAESICRDFKVSIAHYEPTISEPGLFWIPGEYKKADVLVKFEKEVEHAREMQNEWFMRLVGAADDDWAKFHMRRMISSLQKTAANVLKLEREWNMDMEVAGGLRLIPCKYCRADIEREAIVCRYCQGILDMDRYQREYKKAGSVPADAQAAVTK